MTDAQIALLIGIGIGVVSGFFCGWILGVRSEIERQLKREAGGE